MLRRFALILTTVAALSATANSRALAGSELIMVEEHGCFWCERWNREIADIYPKTAEGKAAPLRRVDMHQPWPSDLEFAREPFYTPTFILMRAKPCST